MMSQALWRFFHSLKDLRSLYTFLNAVLKYLAFWNTHKFGGERLVHGYYFYCSNHVTDLKKGCASPNDSFATTHVMTAGKTHFPIMTNTHSRGFWYAFFQLSRTSSLTYSLKRCLPPTEGNVTSLRDFTLRCGPKTWTKTGTTVYQQDVLEGAIRRVGTGFFGGQRCFSRILLRLTKSK